MSEQGHVPLRVGSSHTGPHRPQEEKKRHKPDVQDEKRCYDGVNAVAEGLHALLAEGLVGQVRVEQHGVGPLLHRPWSTENSRS